MKAVDVVNRLKEILPKFTDDFSDISTITSLTRASTTITCTHVVSSISILSIIRSGTTATVTTVSDHGLSTSSSVTISGATQTDYNITAAITVTSTTTFTYTVAGSPATPATGTIVAQPVVLVSGNYVTIRGAKEPIALTSITRVDGIVTVTSATDHKLSDPSLYSLDQLPLYVEIAGVTPSGYNGTFELLTVPTGTTFTFSISTTPTTPATVAGYLLLEDQDGFNGYKQVTVTSATTFTYTTTNSSLGTPAQGTLQLSAGTRIDYAATPARIAQFYSENSSGALKNWMFVVLGGTSIYKNDTIASDLSTAQTRNQNYWYQSQRDLSIYVALSSKSSTLGGAQADTARSYESALLKSLANHVFASALSDSVYQPTVYVANETDDYVDAYYIHRFDFLAKGFITKEDTAAFSNGTPLQLINGTITDKGMTYKPTTRTL